MFAKKEPIHICINNYFILSQDKLGQHTNTFRDQTHMPVCYLHKDIHWSKFYTLWIVSEVIYTDIQTLTDWYQLLGVLFFFFFVWLLPQVMVVAANLALCLLFCSLISGVLVIEVCLQIPVLIWIKKKSSQVCLDIAI